MSTDTETNANPTAADILGNILREAAEAGIDAGRRGTAVNSTAGGIALTILTEHRLAARATVYPHAASRRQAETAVQAVRAQHAKYQQVRDTLGQLDPGQFLADAIHIGEETWIVQIGGGEPGTVFARAPYQVVHGGRATARMHVSLDEALLYAVELRNSADRDPQGYRYAARILGVRTAFDAEEG